MLPFFGTPFKTMMSKPKKVCFHKNKTVDTRHLYCLYYFMFNGQ